MTSLIFVCGEPVLAVQASVQSLLAGDLACSSFFAAPSVEALFRPGFAALDGLIESAAVPKERLSVEHQQDLLKALLVPRRAAALRELGVDLVALSMGIADSDVGKLALSWQQAILQPSAESDAFLDFLRGRSESPAGHSLRGLLNSIGASGRGLLSPSLSNTEIRHAFEALPILRGYLHELPGLRSAMMALNRGEIDEAIFRRRLSTNLFHNDGGGSDFPAGFWQTVFTARLIPAALVASRSRSADRFFVGTVFEGATINGVTLPRYSAPITVEGFYHAILDRLSQGTRGGVLKIFVEKGGDSLEKLEQALVVDPPGAAEQLESLAATVRATLWLTPRQRFILISEIDRSVARIAAFARYAADHVRVVRRGQRIAEIVFSRSAVSVSRGRVRVTSEMSAAEFYQALLEFVRTEERVQRDPML